MKKSICCAAFAASALFVPLQMNAGNINVVDVYKNIAYTQSSGAAPTTPSGFFADVELQSVNNGDFDSVSVADPGPVAPFNLPQVSPNFFSYGPGFASQAAMDTAVPTGQYDFTASNSATSDTETATLNYTGDAFASAIPALQAATFNALNGLDPSMAITINFNSFSVNPNASQAFTFFTIGNASGSALNAGFLNPSTTQIVLAANTLQANTTYTFELDFSNRQNGFDQASGAFTVVGSDVRTDGTFTTGAIVASPEPATFLLAGACSALLVLRRRNAR